MAKFKMRTVEIEAAQVCRLESKENDELLATRPPGWLFRQERIKRWDVTDDGKIVIATLFGNQHIKPGDWIVQRSDGTLHVLSDEEFKAKYEPVADVPAVEGESPKRDECGSKGLHLGNNLIDLFEIAFQEVLACKNNDNFEGIVRSAFEQVQKNHNEIKNQWFSRGWQLAISLADEYKMELGSRRFVDTMGAMLDLSNTIIKMLELKSSESTQNKPEPSQENPRSEPLYYLQNVSAGCVGNPPQFWRQGDSGYTAWISTARKFTAKEIEEIIRSTRGSHEFAAWHTETIDMIADKVVDMQELRGYKPSFTTRSMNSDCASHSEQQSASSETSVANETDDGNPSIRALFYLQNESVGYIGNSPVFWKEGGNGYTPWVNEAQLFTFPEASKIVRSTRGTHRFAIWPARLIVGLVRGVVDIQALRVFSPIRINNDSTCNDRQTEQIIDANGPTN